MPRRRYDSCSRITIRNYELSTQDSNDRYKAVAPSKKMPAPTPRERARAARNDVYRQHILEVAEQVFAERGFEAAKLQEISKRVSLSMGTIYAVFPNKAELLAAILDARGRDLLQLAREVAERGDRPIVT